MKPRKAAGALSDNPRAIGELRSEMKDEFVSVRSDMREEFASVRSEMRDEFASVRSEMKDGFAKVRVEFKDEFAKIRGEFAQLRTEQVVVRTMLGFLIAGVLSIVLKLYV